jgi:hypothetical protein
MRFGVAKEKMIMAVVWKLPRWLVYWCAIRLMAHASQDEYGGEIVGEIKMMDALKRWEPANES